MMQFAKNLFESKLKKQDSDFSHFFRYASSSEKSKLLKRVAREANEDQKELVERYKKQQQGAY